MRPGGLVSRPLVVALGVALLGGTRLVGERMRAVPPVVAEDVVTLAGGQADPDAIVLVSGRRGDFCDVDEEHRGWGTVSFQAFGDWSSGDTRCKSDVVVFSTEHAVYAQRDPWHNGRDDVQPTLRDRLGPKLNIWLVSKDNSDVDLIKADTAKASQLFASSRAGVTLGANGNVTMVAPGSPRGDSIGLGCENVYMLLQTKPPLYDAAAINVYYVPRIETGDINGPKGYTCFEWGAPNVIYMSLQDYSEVTLAHELGHAFGLRGWMGHTKSPRFTIKNIMRTGLQPDQDANRDHFTLGQAYRMNVDESSLLNRLFPTDRVVVWCQDSVPKDFPCVLLQRKASPPP